MELSDATCGAVYCLKREGAQLEEKAECERRKRGLDIDEASAQQEVLAAPLCSMWRRQQEEEDHHAARAVNGRGCFSHLKPQFGFNDMAENNKPRGCRRATLELFLNIDAYFQF